MNKSDDIIEICKALKKFNELAVEVNKNSKNPFFKSTYSDLNEVITSVREPLAQCGLSFTQFPISDQDYVGVETILMHESGQWISNKVLLPSSKWDKKEERSYTDAQSFGSCITYARRYALKAILGLPDVDDDGNSASEAKVHTKKQPVISERVSFEQITEFDRLTAGIEADELPKKLMKSYEVNALMKLTKVQASSLITKLST